MSPWSKCLFKLTRKTARSDILHKKKKKLYLIIQYKLHQWCLITNWLLWAKYLFTPAQRSVIWLVSMLYQGYTNGSRGIRNDWYVLDLVSVKWATIWSDDQKIMYRIKDTIQICSKIIEWKIQLKKFKGYTRWNVVIETTKMRILVKIFNRWTIIKKPWQIIRELFILLVFVSPFFF